MLIVGDQRVKLMEDSMRASGESMLDYRFIVSSDGTIRTSFLEMQEELKKNEYLYIAKDNGSLWC